MRRSHGITIVVVGSSEGLGWVTLFAVRLVGMEDVLREGCEVGGEGTGRAHPS